MILSDLDTVGVWDAVIDAEPALGVVLVGDRFDAALVAIASFVEVVGPVDDGTMVTALGRGVPRDLRHLRLLRLSVAAG